MILHLNINHLHTTIFHRPCTITFEIEDKINLHVMDYVVHSLYPLYSCAYNRLNKHTLILQTNNNSSNTRNNTLKGKCLKIKIELDTTQSKKKEASSICFFSRLHWRNFIFLSIVSILINAFVVIALYLHHH